MIFLNIFKDACGWEMRMRMDTYNKATDNIVLIKSLPKVLRHTVAGFLSLRWKAIRVCFFPCKYINEAKKHSNDIMNLLDQLQ